MNTKALNVFHEGEIYLQERAGTREFAQQLGEMKMRSDIQDDYKSFIQDRHMVWTSSFDNKTGNVWASVLFASPVLEEAERKTRQILTIEKERMEKMRKLQKELLNQEIKYVVGTGDLAPMEGAVNKNIKEKNEQGRTSSDRSTLRENIEAADTKVDDNIKLIDRGHSSNHHASEELRTKIEKLKLKEEVLELEEMGILSHTEESTDILPESGDFCKPFDSCSVGTYPSNLTSSFQSSCYHPLIQVENPTTINILKRPDPSDPLSDIVEPGSMISLNFIEFETRKRFRCNCIITSPLSETGFNVCVLEAFTTCPKYIQRRSIIGIRDQIDTKIQTSEDHPSENCQYKEYGEPDSQSQPSSLLPDHLIDLIIQSDTFMIATYDPKRGADSSHRGGRRGFVRVIDRKKLVWGDYIGKGMFQTLGNTVTYSKAGLLFFNWKTGDILQLTGTIKIDWEDKLADTGPGTGLDDSDRTVIFTVSKWRFSLKRSPFIWKYLQPSSHSPLLHDDISILQRYGKNVVSALQVETERKKKLRKKDYFIPTKLIKIREESPNARTFRFKTNHPIAYQPGQYSTWTIDIEGISFLRSWTISSANVIYIDIKENALEHLKTSSKLVTNYFDITVKRKEGGKVSNYLMNIDPKDIDKVKLTLMGIEGHFTLSSSLRLPNTKLSHKRQTNWKLAMISGGIGITPIMSMLRGVKHNYDIGLFSDSQLPNIVLVHTEHSIESIPFKDDLYTLSKGDRRIMKLALAITSESRDSLSEEETKILKRLAGSDSSDEILFGRVNKRFLVDNISDMNERIIYLCGPDGFMSAMVSILKELNVTERQIVTESFGY